MKKALLVLVLAGLGITAYGYLGFRTIEFIPEVSTVTLARGDVVDTVGATGTLEAVTTVQVGSQVSGIIEELHADFNSIVREGDVIARLEPSLFETQIEQARANLARADAEVERLRVTLENSQSQLARSEDLASRDLISDTELEAAQVAVRSSEAQLKSAEASVIQSQASLNQNAVNLGHTVIAAPIDGIVIARQVDVGQTVAASMSAPELFIIAADLTKMQVIANIDESDVGRIRPGQAVTFTVDAYPAEEFEGTVSQIRLEPVVVQNVVTYATVIDVPNNELKLKPGMTATVTLEIARRENVLRLPNSALRFRPTPEMFAALNQPVPEILQRQSPDRPRSVSSAASPQGERPSTLAQGRGSGRPPGAGRFANMTDDERQRMRERIQRMTPEQRAEFFASRGGGQGRPGRPGRQGPGQPGRSASRGRPRQSVSATIPTVERGAATIDALFAPIEIVETTGRVWVTEGNRLQAVAVRLGVSDGTATELLGIPPQTETPQAMSNSDPQLADLREQITQLEPGQIRDDLQTRLDQLEGASNMTPARTAAPTMVSALPEGSRLVTGVTTPSADTPGSSSRGGSPLIPQFGRRRR